jgi:hypothetical protein
VLIDALHRPTEPFCVLGCQTGGQGTDVFDSFSKWWYANWEHIQPVKKVIAESFCPNFFAKIATRRASMNGSPTRIWP